MVAAVGKKTLRRDQKTSLCNTHPYCTTATVSFGTINPRGTIILDAIKTDTPEAHQNCASISDQEEQSAAKEHCTIQNKHTSSLCKKGNNTDTKNRNIPRISQTQTERQAKQHTRMAQPPARKQIHQRSQPNNTSKMHSQNRNITKPTDTKNNIKHSNTTQDRAKSC